MARRPADPKDEAGIDATRAPFLQHLEELRWRLWRAVVGVLIAGCISYYFHDQLYHFLTQPLYDTLARHKLEQAVKFRTIQGPFLFHMQTAVMGGIFFGLPYVMYQLWQFIAPGLYAKERRFVIPFVGFSTLFFVGGAAFCYFYVLPFGYDFFLDYAVTQGPHKLLPEINIEDYLDAVIKLLLAFGGIFEMPLLAAFLAGVGLITHRGMLRVWRYATVAAFVIGAVLTPPDVMSQIMMSVPLLGLYWLSIGVAWYITKRKERAAAEREAADAAETTALAPTDHN
jgi:sec-independent protein translocase protein TatC